MRSLRRPVHLTLTGCLVGALSLGCAGAPASSGRRTVLMSDEGTDSARAAERRGPPPLATVHDDQAAGREAAKQVAAEIGLLGDEALDAYVTQIGERLLRGIPRRRFAYHFAVVDQVEPNAFSLPGGYVFVSRGLLALTNSEDELANVIGHEITHVAHRHAAAQQAAAARMLPLTMPWIRAASTAAYSRDMERDADRGGQLLAAAAGFDPMGMSTFLQRLGQWERLESGPHGPSFFDTHPTSVERASVNAVRASEIRWRRDPGLGDTHEAHLRRLEGLPLGARPEGGIFEGTLFLHPALGFQLRFPDGWRMENTASAVGAISPRGDAVVYLTADLPAGKLSKVADAFVAKTFEGRARIRDARPVKLGSLPAWRIELETAGLGGSLYVLSTFFSFRDATWRITGVTPAMLESRQRARFLATARSFRPIDPELRARLHPTRLHLVTARAGEDLETLSARTGNVWSLARTAVMNGLFSTQRFTGGELVKIALREPS